MTIPHGRPFFTASAIELDRAGRTCLRDSPVVELTRREYAILEYLSRHKGVVPKADIIGHVWGFAFDGGDNVVEVHISALCRKLRSDLIDTVRGSGYRTTDPVRRPVADDTRARRWLLWPASDARWPPLTDDPPVPTG